eukprot:TRINITY_DN11740_c0_g1::TRINITY_DN11740_c0_g1_i1::g.11646::m.11646 TRINITY_DN11740_c0_g1::TRINITY_DN11740_c0_g1_i1::g.11646  ORF type:complete len:186 (-),score=55.83,sp/Q9VSF3/UBC12_DROME/56.40/2e-67,UQ_con/PF00179.21/1.7e-36,RWD/PF05773.17/0.021,UEV/PF05743.8/0.034,DapB_N/PF01113.15/0.26 TRINITY_DN11740_c0_g1_i1:846-1403(-)
MIKLFEKKQQKKQDDEASKSGAKAKTTPGQIRAQKDVNDLSTSPSVVVDFPNPNDIMHFKVTVTPEEGYYRGGSFLFNIAVPDQYPHEAPKVKCETKVYHPNIDYEGSVCLNILREDWKPVLSLNAVIIGLQHLFLEPNAGDPLNKPAAELLINNRTQFINNIKRSMQGYSVDGQNFPPQPGYKG